MSTSSMRRWALRVGVPAVMAAGVSYAQPALAQDETDQRLGTVHFQTSCNDVAQRRFDRAMRYQHSFWYRQAGEIFLAIGNDREGVRWLESALREDPHHQATHRVLRDYYARVGRADLAFVHQRALQ